MKLKILVFTAGLIAFGLVFFAMDYIVMDMQGLPLMFEHKE